MAPNTLIHRGLALAFLLALPVLVLFAEAIDLPLAAAFFDPALDRFPARGQALPEMLHAGIALVGRLLAALFALGLVAGLLRRRLLGIDARAHAFLLSCLVVGPFLLGNVVLKNQWGRARPVQLEQFGGSHEFTPPLWISRQCEANCSFVSGDASLGFMLHAFAYLPAARRRRHLLFWAGMGAGIAAGALRIWMGAHFLSDVVFSAGFMLLAGAACHALFYGRDRTMAWWRQWWSPSAT